MASEKIRKTVTIDKDLADNIALLADKYKPESESSFYAELIQIGYLYKLKMLDKDSNISYDKLDIEAMKSQIFSLILLKTVANKVGITEQEINDNYNLSLAKIEDIIINSTTDFPNTYRQKGEK